MKYSRVQVSILMCSLVLLLICGCENPGDTAMLGALLSGNAVYASDPQNAAAFATLGNSATGFANSQVGAGNYGQQQQNTNTIRTKEDLLLFTPIHLENIPKGQLANFFTVRKWSDLNGDGKCAVSEFFGIGECINQGENISFAYSPYFKLNSNGKVFSYISAVNDLDNPRHTVKYIFRIFNPDGNEIYKDEGITKIYDTLFVTLSFPQVDQSHMGRRFKAVIDIETKSVDIGNKTEAIDFRFCENNTSAPM